MINNGWIDANGNVISIKGNIDESAFEYCQKFLSPNAKNILDLYIIKYGDVNRIDKDKEIYSHFMIICLGFIKISNSKICIPENRYEIYEQKYQKIYQKFGFNEMIFPKLIYNRENGSFVSYNEKSMFYRREKSIA